MRRHAVTIVAAAALGVIALDGGGFTIGARAAIQAVVVAAIVSAMLLGSFSVGRAAALAAGALGALAAVSVASALWASDPETALAEGSRWGLYASVFLLAAGVLRREDARAIADGLAAAIVLVGLAALASRAQILSDGALPDVVPAVSSRLSYPLQYWNGLGLLMAAGVPLLAQLVAGRRAALVRVAALVGLAVAVAVIYLTSSRGAVVAAVAGLAVLVAVDGRAFARLRARVHGRTIAAVACALVLGVVLVSVAALDPAGRWERFTAPPAPGQAAADNPGFVASHLLSGGGSGRWQFWQAAVDEFTERPLAGGGAGSYEAWWAEHGTLPDTIRDAHSLGLQTFAELGLLGGVLLLAALAVAALAAFRGVRSAAEHERSTAASLFAAAVVVLLGVQIDWSWNLPAVAAVALVALAALSALAARPPRRKSARVPHALAGAAALAALAALAATLAPWLVTTEIAASRDAVTAGDMRAALEHARSARALAPWASSPLLQEALVLERAGDPRRAAIAITAAVQRDPEDWRLRLVAARMLTFAGRAREADSSLQLMQRLAPRFAVTTGVLRP